MGGNEVSMSNLQKLDGESHWPKVSDQLRLPQKSFDLKRWWGVDTEGEGRVKPDMTVKWQLRLFVLRHPVEGG